MFLLESEYTNKSEYRSLGRPRPASVEEADRIYPKCLSTRVHPTFPFEGEEPLSVLFIEGEPLSVFIVAAHYPVRLAELASPSARLTELAVLSVRYQFACYQFG